MSADVFEGRAPARSELVWYAVAVSALSVAVFTLVLGWSTVTAPFSTADEPRHANSVLRLMQGGGWPDAKTAPMVEGIFIAAAEAGEPLDGEMLEQLPSPEDRSVVSSFSEAGGDRVIIDWMTQHPPGYYAVVAGSLSILGADSWRWDQLILGMRAFSAAMAALAVPFVAASVRLISGSRAAAVVGAGLLLAIPQYGHVLGLVTNDSLATLLGAVLMYLVVRALLRGNRLNVLALVTGIVLGFALLTKGLMLAAVPFVLIGMLIAGWRRGGRWWSRLLPAAISMSTAFVIGGWWWVRNLFVYGELQPSVFGSGRDEESPSVEYSLPSFIFRVAERLNHTFWGSFRAELDLPGVITTIAGVCALAVLVSAIAFSKQRVTLLILAIYPVLTFAIFTFHAWEIFWDVGTIRGVQGRYLYSGITLLAASIGVVWSFWLRVAHAATAAVTSAVALLSAGAAGLTGILFAFRYLWGAEGVRAMLESGAMTIPAFATVAVVFAVAVLVAAAGAAVCAANQLPKRRDKSPEDPVTFGVEANAAG